VEEAVEAALRCVLASLNGTAALLMTGCGSSGLAVLTRALTASLFNLDVCSVRSRHFIQACIHATACYAGDYLHAKLPASTAWSQ
jgi:hypothetical protein